MLREQVLYERAQLESKIKNLERQLKKYPPGKISCIANGGYQKWFVSDGHKQIYLPKKERQLAESLAQKKYLTLQLKNALQEKEAIDSYLKYSNPNAFQMEQDFLSSSLYGKLLTNSFQPLSQKLSEWQNSPYEKNMKYPERLNVKAASGIYVRSKSEALINLYLFKNHIPFRYEAALQFGEIVLYPDFTILHPRTEQLFYWEHFGLADDPIYIKTIASKTQLYISNGILPNIQLITTYETRNHPLTSNMVEKIVNDYFLSSYQIH